MGKDNIDYDIIMGGGIADDKVFNTKGIDDLHCISDEYLTENFIEEYQDRLK